MKLHKPGIDSRKCHVKVEFEAAIVTTTATLTGGPQAGRIVRVRTEDGKWLRKETWLRRVEALGIKFIMASLEDKAEGEHTPQGEEL